MGTSKTEQFTDKKNNIATLLKALGHPARVTIVEHLLEVDSCVCGDIVNELPLAQSTVSQHLKELKTAGIIKGEIDGASVCYCLNEKSIKKLQKYFAKFSKKLEKKNNKNC